MNVFAFVVAMLLFLLGMLAFGMATLATGFETLVFFGGILLIAVSLAIPFNLLGRADGA
ncbi:hypothetical protein ARHIZOSPH14_24650 [Agromyces rhizosphaerae]|uniref:Uncharacterized protein n=1 Tax=Agromyces rhizosphaerae TaxID=88374 RepID=A0A9W6D282_9MICO|nr:hypothetical protein [Agromyces rhizosphaerae]GLI28223.1 hypothetical protein ARHIZOSPH14_24650 [Agromyces rhizosphaerae]